MSDEVFHTISVPNISHEGREWGSSLAVWNESFMLNSFHNEEETGPSIFAMWVMYDSSDQVKSPWNTKLLTIESEPRIEIPLAFWKRDELYMVATDGRIVSCNICTQKLKYLLIDGTEDNPCTEVVYVESIVSVKGDNKLKCTDPNRLSARSVLLSHETRSCLEEASKRFGYTYAQWVNEPMLWKWRSYLISGKSTLVIKWFHVMCCIVLGQQYAVSIIGDKENDGNSPQTQIQLILDRVLQPILF